MFRKKKKDYLELNDVRVSYDENDNSVHITGKDKNLPKHTNEVHLKLDGDRAAEDKLRNMLEDAGIITESHYIPSELSYDDIADSHWYEFPIGKAAGTQPVVWNPMVSPHLLINGPVGSGKSVIERSIVFHCLQHPEQWRVLAIDPWNELSSYEKYAPAILGVIKDLDEVVEACHFVLEEMMERHEKMKEFAVTNYQDLPDAPYGIIFLLDEIGGLFAESGSKAIGAKEEDELKREAATVLTKIAQLGHAAGIHLVLASQHPDSSVFTGRLKSHMSTRIVMGRVDEDYSSLAIDNAEASQIPWMSRGRGYIQEGGKGKHFQAAFTELDWYDKWLRQNNIGWYKDNQKEPNK